MTITVATHNGKFHADDVFAIAIIKKIHPDLKVIRTRDQKVIEEADMRVDVGGKYNPETNDFDHHQSDFTEKRENTIPYCACGLIWKHFGEEIIGSESAANHLDKKLIQEIDANDAGINTYEQKDEFTPYTISSAVQCFNPRWTEEQDGDLAFEKALNFASAILEREIQNSIAREKSTEIVKSAIENSPCKEYIVLEQYLPWGHVVEDYNDILYVIFKSNVDKWNVVCVNVKKGSFENKKDLPKEWAGLKDEELANVSGVPDAIFCHNARFMAVANSKEGAIKLAELALKN